MMRFRYSLGFVLILALAAPLWGEYPRPSPYPISWELKFDHSKPKRITVAAPTGESTPRAYWYMTYHVVNNSTKDTVLFYPTFELMLQDGRMFQSDQNIPPAVFQAIKQTEKIPRLQDALDVSGELRHGEDQSRDGVAIWPEPTLRLGTFNIFIKGFWDEATTVKIGDKDVILHKSLQLTYHVDADENHPGQGEVAELNSQYVMR